VFVERIISMNLSGINWLFFCLATLIGSAEMSAIAVETNEVRTVIPARAEGRMVDTNTMQRIFDEVKTPFKYGVVLKGESTNEFLDCPSIFRSGKHWYMMYVAITNKIGYQTCCTGKSWGKSCRLPGRAGICGRLMGE
jgi:hypothetical protein